MLTPLLTYVHNVGTGETGSSSSGSENQVPTVVAEPGGLGSADIAKAAAAAAAAASAKGTATLSGWTLKLVLEYCDQVGEQAAIGRTVRLPMQQYVQGVPLQNISMFAGIFGACFVASIPRVSLRCADVQPVALSYLTECLQGTLRSALDKALLKRPGAAFAEQTLVMMLARDVAAAMLHLHR